MTESIEVSNYTHVYYISQQTGSDRNGDGSQLRPYKSIRYALNQIKINSEINRIALFIGEGTYSGSTINMKPFVDLFGGFSSKTWERDIYKNTTVLHGENSRRVVVGSNNALIDGFKIKEGLSRSHGGGILCEDTSPTISNCFIVNNYVLEPDNFNNERIHQDGYHGGGIACRYNAVPVIRNNVFYGNKTSIGNGAALSFYGWLRSENSPEREIVNNFMEGGWQPVVKNNVFIQNVSGVNDINRTRSSNGAAISCAFEARPIIKNNVIVCNQAKGRSDAGGIYSEHFSYPEIIGNWILGNICDDDGGGIYTNHTGHAVITGNYIAGNETIGKGVGGIRISKEGRASISHNIIVYNQSGGGVHSVDGYMALINNVIMNNKGPASVRITNHFNYFMPSTIDNNIIRDNEGIIDIEESYKDKVIIKNNNIDNYSKPLKFNHDLINGRFENIKFNDQIFQSIIFTNEIFDRNFIGRVIRIDKFWSVITKAESNKLFVWGNANWNPEDKNEFIILSDYQE
ncbi:right-handed parallel beta-helix repeat-containing protein [Bacteroidota bacterium]